MTREKYNQLNEKANNGEIKEQNNPAFILRGTSIQLLIQIAKGEINMQELAKRELENIGHDINGMWVGFDKEIK
jgi:hypothetical protein